MSEPYDKKLVWQADETVKRIIDDALQDKKGFAVVGEAPAGAGKSHAIGTAVLEALKRGLRVAVASPTNEQAFSLIDAMAPRLRKGDVLTYVPASSLTVPPHVTAHSNVKRVMAKEANTGRLIVGTLSKFGDAFAREHLEPVDLLLIDEAFQANAVHYYGVADLAERHLLMGDRGQLAPFSTAAEGHHWRGLDEDPLLTSAEVVQRNHPLSTRTHKLPITRRLDPRGVKIARAFYPGHEFGAAVLPGVRNLKLQNVQKKNHLDAALEMAADSGWAHLEMSGLAESLADPGTIVLMVDLVKRLLERQPTVTCERAPKPRRLRESDIAVVASHNDQTNLLRVALDDAGCDEVVVNTANKLQGLTYEVVVAWHPLAGLMEVDGFHLDPGRLCVMMTRHRQACIVVGRDDNRRLVEGIPPSSEAYVGCDAMPTLDGWYAHEQVFSLLEPHRIAVPR